MIPEFHYADWTEQPSSWDYLRQYCHPIPLVWRPGTLGDKAAECSDLQIEAALRNHIYLTKRWTGTQTATTPNVDSAINLLQGELAWETAHPGEKPEYGCAPLSTVFIALLAFHRLKSRMLWTSSWLDGQEDNVVEVYSRSLRRWYMVVPHLNLHFEWMGRRLSAREWATFDRAGGTESPRVEPITISGNGHPRFFQRDLNFWRTMGGYPCVQAGNYVQAGGAQPFRPENWRMFPLLPRLGQALSSHGDPNVIVPYGTFDQDALDQA